MGAHQQAIRRRGAGNDPERQVLIRLQRQGQLLEQPPYGSKVTVVSPAKYRCGRKIARSSGSAPWRWLAAMLTCTTRSAGTSTPAKAMGSRVRRKTPPQAATARRRVPPATRPARLGAAAGSEAGSSGRRRWFLSRQTAAAEAAPPRRRRPGGDRLHPGHRPADQGRGRRWVLRKPWRPAPS